MAENISDKFHSPLRRKFFKVFILLLVCFAVFAILLTPLSVRPSVFPIREGEVSTQDIQAPNEKTYISNILTEQAKTSAYSSVEPIYLPADPSITRVQINKLHSILDFITNIRADSYSTNSQKEMDLKQISGLVLQSENISTIINLTDSDWEIVISESLLVLEQVMRTTIRDANLMDTRRNIPALISLSTPQDQANIVLDLVTPFVVPNSLVNEEQTEAARLAQLNSIEPVSRTYASGEIIVRRGQVITPLVWEALIQFGLIQPEDNTKDVVSSALIIALLAGFVVQYFLFRSTQITMSLRYLTIIALLFLIFFASARFIVPNRVVMPYMFPLAAFSLTLSCVFSIELGLIFSLVTGIITAFNLPNSLDLTLFYVLTGMIGILSLKKAQRISNFILSGLGIGLSGTAILVAYRLPGTIDLIGIATLIGAAFFNGIASASVAILLQYLISQLLGLTTPMQLLELQRPDHPLSKFILQNSPGTYQHSLQVANLAEQAAEAIGADPLLTRVGAIYHDAGKAANPTFFVENQVAGSNPHDTLDPLISASIILRHVTDGFDLGRKYRLPRRLLDFVLEHHGTLITRYQYARALEAAGGDESKVDIERFRYSGPRPQSRETALLMLADNCEARVRATPPKDEQGLRDLIQRTFDYVQQQHQLDDTRLSIRDLNLAALSFFHTLKNIYHPRIPYPEIKKNNQTDTNPSISNDEASQK